MESEATGLPTAPQPLQRSVFILFKQILFILTIYRKIQRKMLVFVTILGMIFRSA